MIKEEAFLENLPLGSAAVSTAHEPNLTMMDESSFQAFYSQTARPLWLYIHRVCRSAVLADDILQESYFRYLRTPLPVMGEGQMRAYLFKIATRLIHDHWRRSKREEHWFSQETTPQDLKHPALTDSDKGMDLERVFQKLKPQDRSLLWLAYVEGAEHREIADTLGLKEKSIRVLLFRARKKVAALLTKNGSNSKGSL